MYHALYRKYRPVDFDSVVGQDVIVKTLKNSIIHNSFSHAYIFFGSRGTGKTTLSKIFARNINCLNPIDGSACGKCDNCLISFSKECVDIIEIDAASNNGVDEIRELKSKINLVPSQLKYKVYIIDEVHMLSTGAFNALLKTLEEPPNHAIFILATTDLQKVPETIISRCQCFSFNRISNDVIKNRLKYVCEKENISYDDSVLMDIALASDGGLRDALGYLDKLCSYSPNHISSDDFYDIMGSVSSKLIEEFVNFVFLGNVEKILFHIDSFHNLGKNFIQIINQIIYYLSNEIHSYYVFSNKLSFSLNYYISLLTLLVDKNSELKKSTNVRLLFETLLLKFIHDTVKKDNFNSSFMDHSVKPNESINYNSNIELSSINGDIKSSDNVNNNSSNLNTDIEEEFDFSKEFDYPSESESDMNFNTVDKSFSNDISMNDDIPKIININDIMKVRIHNTLACADKTLLKNEIKNFELLKDFTFDQEIGYLVCSLLDSKIRVVSSDSMIISFMYDSNVKQNLILLDKLTDIYNKITKSNKKIAIVSDQEWDSIKNQYISDLKNHITYSLQEEPEVIFEDLKKNDIISNRAIELFGNVVEID